MQKVIASIARCRSFFRPPTFAGDEEKTRTARILNHVLSTIFLILFLSMTIALPFFYQKKFASFLFICGFLIITLIARRLMHQGSVRLAAQSVVTCLWVISTMLIYMGAGLRDVNMVLVVSITVVAGLLLGQKAAITFAIVSIINALIMVILEWQGYLPLRYFPSSLLVGWIEIAFALALTSTTLNLALKSLDESLGLARERLRERQQVEQALQASEERYRNIFEHAVEGIYQISPEGRLIDVNPAVAKIFGYDSSQEMIENTYDFEKQHYILSQHRQEFRKRLEEQGYLENYEQQMYRKDGSVIWVSLNVRVDKDGNGNPQHYEGSIVDITERKQIEESIRNSEERFRLLANNIPDIIYSVDDKGKIITINQDSLKRYGYEDSEVIGVSFWNFIFTDDKNTLFNAYLEANSQNNPYVKGLKYRILAKDGSLHWVELHSHTHFDNNGRFLSQEGVVRDIGDRMKAESERKKLEDQLIQSQKLEAIGTLAGGIAHDFNNLLMGIQGYASLMLMNIDSAHPHYEQLRNIELQVQSGANLTKQLLGFARSGKYEVKKTNINTLIEQNSMMFERTKKEILINRNFEQDIWNIDVDRGQMDQVFLNLYINAWQAMPAGGKLFIETKNVILDHEEVIPYEIHPGKYVQITVTDTGVGMDENTRLRIFDPFFTTKAMGRGSGLGLASVYGIIRNHGGIINVDSEKGRGTKFQIYLPASANEAPAGAEKAPVNIVRGTETILFVDDEKINLDVGGRILESLGYIVLLAANGHEALDIYRMHSNHIHLVVLDMIMPGMSGKETFDGLKDINPDVLVILSSGYSIDGLAQEIMELGVKAFLQKPFTVEELSLKISGVLKG